MKTKLFIKSLLLALCIASSVCLSAHAQTSAFTYQGKLTDGSGAANGQYDFTFRLFDAVENGTQIGADAVLDNVPVSGGIFSVTLDFGANSFSNGFGIANVRVSMSDSLGGIQTAVTNSFGVFRFEQVSAGETYVLTVHSKRYEFDVPSRVIAVNENVSDIVFIANLK